MKKLRAVIAVLILSVILGACSSVSTDELAKIVMKSMEQKFTQEDISIKSFILTKKAGNEYAGILETKEPNGEFTYNVEVISDGKNMQWQITL